MRIEECGLRMTARREFLKFLAASPYLAALALEAQQAEVIGSPADALSVMDFEEAAHRKVLPGHWAYMASGVDDDATLRANRGGYTHVQLRPRRLRDATKVDMRVDLFGTTYASPIFLCPTGGEKSFHPDGELAVARAASRCGISSTRRRRGTRTRRCSIASRRPAVRSSR